MLSKDSLFFNDNISPEKAVLSLPSQNKHAILEDRAKRFIAFSYCCFLVPSYSNITLVLEYYLLGGWAFRLFNLKNSKLFTQWNIWKA